MKLKKLIKVLGHIRIESNKLISNRVNKRN